MSGWENPRSCGVRSVFALIVLQFRHVQVETGHNLIAFPEAEGLPATQTVEHIGLAGSGDLAVFTPDMEEGVVVIALQIASGIVIGVVQGQRRQTCAGVVKQRSAIRYVLGPWVLLPVTALLGDWVSASTRLTMRRRLQFSLNWKPRLA